MPTLGENKRAYFDYEILETFEAGLQLFGFEVKALRQGRMDLQGSYVVIRGEEAWLLNAKIPSIQPKNVPADYEPSRTRKLLLKKKELRYLIGKTSEKGLTLVPLRVYTKRHFLKLAFGLAKGKKKFEKREILKRKAAEREIERTLKKY